MTTKEKLLQAALKLFAKQGIDKTSTAQISKAVGVSEGALFRHYPTKQRLIDELYIFIKQQECTAFGDVIDASQSVEWNIKHITQVVCTHFIAHYQAFRFLALVSDGQYVSAKAKQKAEESLAGILVMLQKWQKQGTLQPIELSLLVDVCWSMCQSIIRHCHAKKLKTVPDDALEMVWQAVRKQK